MINEPLNTNDIIVDSVTVVPDDNLIIVNGISLIFDYSPIESNLHALQWIGGLNGTGHKEFKDKDNELLSSESYESNVLPYVELWKKEKKRLDELKEQENEIANSLENVKKRKLQEIKNAVDEALAPLSNDYPYKEVLSFSSQEKEARAFLENPDANTPLLTAMAEARGISKEELANKIVAKADASTIATGTIIGQSQKDKDRLAAAETVEQVNEIVPNYKLPDEVYAMFTNTI